MQTSTLPVKTKTLQISSNSLLIAEKAKSYMESATSDNTRTTYRSAIKQFERFGGRLPADKVSIINYLVCRAEDVNTRTLDVHLTAISQWHIFQGLPDPTKNPEVSKTMIGIRRQHGVPKNKAKALRPEHILTLINHLESQDICLKTLRDKAIILCGFFGSFRRSELVSLEIEHLHWEPEGVIVNMPRSKTDQDGDGLLRALPFGDKKICPATALNEWKKAANITTGPVFRPINRWGTMQNRGIGAGAINELLKSLGRKCNFDFIDELSGHSLRRGMATSAAREHIDFDLIKKQGGWKSDAIVWDYIEEGDALTNNAAKILMDKIALII
jgi:integrase